MKIVLFTIIITCLGLQARIKKIMQLDDDVGKVAATVPPVVCKCLLFKKCMTF